MDYSEIKEEKMLSFVLKQKGRYYKIKGARYEKRKFKRIC